MYFWGKGRKIARNKLIRLCEEQPAHGVVLEQAKVHCVFFGFHQPLWKGQCAGSGAKRHLPHPDYAASWCWRGVVFGLQAAGSHNHKKNADCNPANFCKVCFRQFSFISKLFLSNLNSKPPEKGKTAEKLKKHPVPGWCTFLQTWSCTLQGSAWWMSKVCLWNSILHRQMRRCENYSPMRRTW